MKIKNISIALVAFLLLHSTLFAHKNEIKVHLFDNATISSGMQFSQLYSLTSKQVFTTYFSRNVGFRTKYINFGVSSQVYFSPNNIDGFNFNQRILSSGFYAGITYPINKKLELGASFQRNQLKYVEPYTQFNGSDGWFDFKDYRAGYDFNNEIEVKSSYQICDYLWINASAKFGFESEIFGKNYAGYLLGIQATLPKLINYNINVDSLSFKKKRKLYGFLGTTRILKEERIYYHRLNEKQLDNKEINLAEVAFNYDLFEPVATVCAGIISKGGNLFYVNLGKHETFTKDRNYNSIVPLDLFVKESYLYHAKSQYIGISADLNPFSLFKKTSQWYVFPVLSLFGQYEQRQQQSIRNIGTYDANASIAKVMQMDIKANILHYGSAFGVGAKLGRLYGNFKLDLIKGKYANMSAKRKNIIYDNNNPHTWLGEENVADLDLKGNVPIKKESSFLENALFNQSTFTIGILF